MRVCQFRHFGTGHASQLFSETDSNFESRKMRMGVSNLARAAGIDSRSHGSLRLAAPQDDRRDFGQAVKPKGDADCADSSVDV